MLRCFYEKPVCTLDLSLSVSLLDDECVTEAAAAAAASSSAAAKESSKLSMASKRGATRRVFDVAMQLCSLRLMRDLVYKGQRLSPFIPSLQVLLLFPCSIEPTTRAGLAEGAGNKMAAFLSFLHRASGGVAFRIISAMLCSVSGVAALVTESESIKDALLLLDVCSDVGFQGPDTRMSALYIQAYPCHYIPHEEVATAVQQGELRTEFYYIPACPVCTERLEPSLTGMSDSQESPICVCYGMNGMGASSPQRSCTCLQKSTCSVCQQLLSAQLTSSSSSGQPQVRCRECRQSGDPWICMICGYVGCSRYQAMHAKDHFMQSGHFFSINLLTQQIWDYQSDAFVHHVMFIVDANSGKSTRLHYPGIEDAATAELLNDNDDSFDSSAAGDSNAHRSSSKRKCVDPVAEKKVVSGKYDAKLTTSHTQYATVLKNELDAMRSIHCENAWLAVQSVDPSTTLTREAVSRLLESATVQLHDDDGSSTLEEDEDGEDRCCGAFAGAMSAGPVPHPGKPSGFRSNARRRNTDRGVDRRQRRQLQTEPYDDIFASLEPLEAVLVALNHDEQAIAYGTQHLAHELHLREQDSVSLEQTESALTAELRDVVRKNVMDNLQMNNAIEELQATLREIDLNVATQRQLMSRMERGDGAARVVVMGQGRDPDSGKGSAATGGGKARSSKR